MHAEVAIGKVSIHHVNRRHKIYDDLYIRIPMKRAREIGLKPDNYYIMAFVPAQWFDLVDLEKNGYVYNNLPPEIRRHVDWLRKAQEEGIEIGPDQLQANE